MRIERAMIRALCCALGSDATAIIFLTTMSSVATSQTFPGGYSFVLPATDTSSNSQFLPSFPRRPIGPGEFVTLTADGHFAVADQRIRFFGTNLVADAAFPLKSEGWFVAGRLRTLGYNLVRVHHLDNGWSATGSLFGGMPDTRHLNASVLDRMDNLLAELKANGIYANINLHVSRTFRQADGVPDADSLREFAKGCTFFDPLLIMLQKEYAQQLLRHVNPYTGLPLADDPAMAMVEITNENSLYRMWHDDLLKPYAAGGALPVRHQRLLDSLWGSFLARRYANDSALASAWNAGATGPGGIAGLLPGESLSSTPRRLDFRECVNFTDARVKDQTAFYVRLEADFFVNMRSYLRDSLGVRAPIVGTNLTFTPPDLAAQSGLDFMDNHAYWDHPSFTGTPWSPTNWTILNLPMVGHTEGGTIGRLMNGIGLAGKPYTISEYNHPFPNIYQSEGPLFLTAYAALHDVDGVIFYDHNSTTDWTSDGINGFFDMHRNSALMALMPSLARAYRSGAITPARETVVLDLSDDDILLAPKRHVGGWLGPPLVDPTLTLKHGVRTRTVGGPVSSVSQVPAPGSPPHVSDTGELRWDPTGVFSVAAGSFAAVTGFPGIPGGPSLLAVISSSGHGTFTWISPTGRNLDQPGRTLLTVSTRVQNSGMAWDGTTTVHDQWGTPPTLVQPLKATVRLRIAADSLRVWGLDSLGRGRGAVRRFLRADSSMFFVEIDQSSDRTPWYGLEAFGGGTLTVAAAPLPSDWSLEQNYPNPFNPITRISYVVPGGTAAGPLKLVVYDLLGQKVAVLVDGPMRAGKHEVLFDAGRLSSGLYIFRLSSGSFSAARTMLLLR